jgi:hemerythrin-like domain-containing protein
MSHSFGSLNGAHEDLDEVFALHQECLLGGCIDQARRLLDTYRSLIELHIRHEEDRVLPVYSRAANKRWPEELYTGQHQKIRALLDRIEGHLDGFRVGPGWRRRVLELLEVETTLKHLIEHHHLAEDQAFYPTADANSDDSERTRIIAECEGEWRAAMSEHEQTFRDTRSTLAALPEPPRP